MVIFLSGSKDGSFTMPESITIRMPSMVSDVSALFVATMIFLFPAGVASNTLKKQRFKNIYGENSDKDIIFSLHSNYSICLFYQKAADWEGLNYLKNTVKRRRLERTSFVGKFTNLRTKGIRSKHRRVIVTTYAGTDIFCLFNSVSGLEFYRGNRRRGRTKCRGLLRQRRQFFAV